MNTIKIENYKGLSIASSAGKVGIKLCNKELLGTSSGKTKSFGINEDEFVMSDEYRQQAIAFYNNFAKATWTRYLSDTDFKKMNEMQVQYDKKMSRFKSSARMSAFAEVDKAFA